VCLIGPEPTFKIIGSNSGFGLAPADADGRHGLGSAGRGNVADANRRLASSTNPFDVWFKASVLDITGVDFGQPIPAMSETLIDYRV
jgi:hypothetical protein